MKTHLKILFTQILILLFVSPSFAGTDFTAGNEYCTDNTNEKTGITAINVSNLNPFTTVTTGDFSDDATWGVTAPPTASDIVIDHSVNLDINYTAASLTINSGDTLRVKPGIVLKVTGNIINNGHIYFESNEANGSAQFDTFTGTITSTGTSTIPGDGEVTVERFIPAKRIYRFHSSTVNTAGGSKPSINDNWQEGATTTPPPVEDPNPGFGTHITKKYENPSGVIIVGTVEEGFDQTSVLDLSHSLVTYTNNLQRFRVWPDTDPGQLSVGRSYRLFMRGDRSIDINDPNAPPTNTILRSTGQLHTGTFDFSHDHSEGFRRLKNSIGAISLITNPYQSVVDYSEVTRNNDLTNYINVWDANLGGAGDDETRGGYVTVEVPPAGGSISAPSPYSSAANHFVPPGRPFFVKISGTTPEITFEEDDKATGNNTVNINTTDPDFYINSRVYKTLDLQDGNTESDALGLRFNTNNYGNAASLDEDAPADLFNSRVNYKLVDISLSTLWSIEKRKVPNMNDLIQLFIDYDQPLFTTVTDPETNNYSLTFDLGNKPDDRGVYLIDNYSNIETELTGYTEYDFTINDGISGSIDFFRFSLRFYDITYITVENATNWNVGSSWRGGAVPPPEADVIIAHDLNLTDVQTVQTITFIDDATLTNTSQLNIQNGGNINNDDGTEISIAGTVNFQGDGSVNGEIVFNDVVINGGVDFGDPSAGNQSTINGSLMILPTSFVNSNSPVYGDGSTLIYNIGASYGRASEWSNANATQGNPYHVEIRNGTELNLGTENIGNPAVMNGDLTILTGAFLYLDVDGFDMEQPLVIKGDFNNEGTLILSDLSGGDLKVEGDFTDNGTINYKQRALFFEGPNNQQINTTANPYTIDVLRINKSGGEVVMNQDLIIDKTGDPLIMSDQAVLNLNGNNLILGDNIYNSKVQFNGDAVLRGSTSSSLTIKGNGTMGNIPFDQTTDGSTNSLANIYLEKVNGSTVGFSNKVVLKEGITLAGGTLNSNGNLVFASDAATTAIVREVPSNGGEISGDVEIHRYFPQSNRAFRYISSSVNTNTSINTNWQEGATTESAEPNPRPGFGTHITGSTTGANGFDLTQTGNKSLFTFNDSNQGNPWVDIDNTDFNNITAGSPYALMIRGDRSTNLNSNIAVGPATTLRTTGTIVTGDQGPLFYAITSGQYTLVGNPYQARVDMRDILLNHASGFNPGVMYIFDPTIGTIGGYAAVDLSDGTNTTVVPGPSNANQYLQPFQAVILEANGTTPDLTFVETAKTADASNLGTFSDNPTFPNVLDIELIQQNTQILVDAVKLKFASTFTTPKTFEDATKLWNSTEHLAIVNASDFLVIDKRDLPPVNDTIPLYLGNYQVSQYTLRLESTLDSDIEAQLYDHYLDQTLDLANGNNNYDFTIDTAIPGSIDNQRFELIFNPQTLGTEDPLDSTFFKVYPNPTEDMLYIQSSSELLGQDVEMTCFDQLGRLVLSQNISNLEANTSLDLSTLSAGLYLLKLETEGHQETFKIQVK